MCAQAAPRERKGGRDQNTRVRAERRGWGGCGRKRSHLVGGAAPSAAGMGVSAQSSGSASSVTHTALAAAGLASSTRTNWSCAASAGGLGAATPRQTREHDRAVREARGRGVAGRAVGEPRAELEALALAVDARHDSSAGGRRSAARRRSSPRRPRRCRRARREARRACRRVRARRRSRARRAGATCCRAGRRLPRCRAP